jgi:hypothetical protein
MKNQMRRVFQNDFARYFVLQHNPFSSSFRGGEGLFGAKHADEHMR